MPYLFYTINKVLIMLMIDAASYKKDACLITANVKTGLRKYQAENKMYGSETRFCIILNFYKHFCCNETHLKSNFNFTR